MSDDVDDTINVGTALELVLADEDHRPMACCPRDGEPLVMTFEFRGAEFVCVVCDGKFGFLSPRPKPCTPELEARYQELKAQYEAARAEREAT